MFFWVDEGQQVQIRFRPCLFFSFGGFLQSVWRHEWSVWFLQARGKRAAGWRVYSSVNIFFGSCVREHHARRIITSVQHLLCESSKHTFSILIKTCLWWVLPYSNVCLYWMLELYCDMLVVVLTALSEVCGDRWSHATVIEESHICQLWTRLQISWELPEGHGAETGTVVCNSHISTFVCVCLQICVL